MNTFGKLLLLVASVVALAACAPKMPDTAADEAALKSELSAWMEAYNAGNAEGIVSLYSEDAILMAPGSPAATGWAGIRDFIVADIEKSKAAGLILNGGEITGVGVDGNTGWLSGMFSATDGSGATVDTGKFLSVSSRINGEWKLVRDTWNSDMAPASPAAEEPIAEVFAD